MIYIFLYKCLNIFFQSAYLILTIRILLSWIPHDPYHPIVNVIYKCTEPILAPFRNIIPSWKIGIDLSPIFAFLAIGFLRKIIFQILF